MKFHQLRMATNHKRNAIHLRNLRAYVDEGTRFNNLDPIDKELILRQIDIMDMLDEVLTKRMQRLKIPVEI